MKFISKTFSQLSASEIYEILKARMEVFLIEQNIICLDIDGIDYDSLHIFYEDDGKVEGYLRAFKADDHTVKIGRVLTREHGKGLGRKLVENAVSKIKEHFGCDKIVLHSQKHAQEFYKKLGFKAVSDEYLEEGVLHITMEMDV